jgi:hypothetical protein
MAIEGLHLVLRRRHILNQRPRPIHTRERLPIPCQNGGRSVELGQVCEPRVGIVGRVVEAGEVVRGACRDLDAER